MTVEVLSGADAGRAFNPAWDALARLCPQSTVFQSTGWYRGWIETVAAAEGATPIVVMLCEDGVRAAIALQLARRGSETVVEALTTPWADYHDALAVDHEAAARLVPAIIDVARANGAAVRLDELVPNGILARALTAAGVELTDSSPVAAIDMSDAGLLEGLFAGRTYRIKLRRLARLGSFTVSHYQSAEDILARMPEFIEMHRRQWSAQQNCVGGFDGGVVDRAFEAMVRHLAPSRSVVLTDLRFGDQSMAMDFGLRWGDVYGSYRTTFNQAFGHLSPGHLILRQMISDFKAEGVATFDLMRGAYAFKQRYTNRWQFNRRWTLPVPATASSPG
jgi:CelD/BcsL family acetyltransferase involved in cellulose biosynthesis